MYNFFDRIKTPLKDYRNYNPHKKDDDFVDIEEQITSGQFPNEYGSNAIELPNSNNTSPIFNSISPNALKQSQHISKSNFVNPLSLPSSLIPPPPSYNSQQSLNETINNNLRNTTISISPQQVTTTSPQHVTTISPHSQLSNVVSVPSEIAECNTANKALSPIESQQSHLLPNSELKNNNNINSNFSDIVSNGGGGGGGGEDYNTLMDQSNKLQMQMQILMQKMQQMQQMQNNLQCSNVYVPPQQLLNHSQRYPNGLPVSANSTRNRHMNIPTQPQQPQQYYSHNVDAEHDIPHSKRVELEEKLKNNATEIEMKDFNQTSSRFGNSNTFYNPNFNNDGTEDKKLEESTINVDAQQHEKDKSNVSTIQSSTISPTIRSELDGTSNKGDVILNIDDGNGKTIITTTKVGNSPNGGLVGDDSDYEKINNNSKSTADGRSTIKMVIPKIKSKLNREKMQRFKKGVFQVLLPSQTQVPVHIVDAVQTEGKVVPFLMELGRALLMSGVPANRLEFELTLISSTFGLDGHFFSTPTGIFFSFGSPHSILSPYTHFLRINSTDYNMQRMIKLEELADKVIYGQCSCVEALDELKKILAMKSLYNIYFSTVSYIVASFTIGVFFSIGWVEIGCTSIIGLYVGLLCLLSSKVALVGRVLEALSATGGAIIASLYNCYVYPIPIFTVTLGGIISLAPGLGLTLAVAEISTRNLVSGTSRLVGVFSCLLQLTFGIALGTKFSEVVMPLREESPSSVLPDWVMFIVIPFAAISFGVQLKVHWKQFWVIIIASYIGVTVGNWGSKYFGDVGSFFGSCAICALGNLYSRFSNISAVVPIMAGIILLVPGSMGVKGLISVTDGNIAGGMDFIQGMFMVAASLTLGLLVANLIIPPPKSM